MRGSRCSTATGAAVDCVRSYTAVRSVSVQGDRIVLNGRPLQLRMVLGQGYWPETGLTAPDDAALRRDVELAKSMGFNGVRKHQKVEDPRYLYLSEFGGIACAREGAATWGYSRADDPTAFAQRYATLLTTVRAITLFAGFCYTQFSDTYQEANGLLYADRTPKFPLTEIALATRGPRTQREESAGTRR